MSSEAQGIAPASTYAMRLAYDGRPYYGWQRHGEKPTVQGAVEDAVQAVLGWRSAVQGSGRTDRGAHAEGQVASLSLPAGLDCEELRVKLNASLAESIRVTALAAAPEGFHALESCIGKRYRYEIWLSPDCPKDKCGRVWHATRPLNIRAMREAALHLVGRQDFASFATKTNFKRKSTVRVMQELIIEDEAPRLSIAMQADGFLYKMVRNLVRALVKVGEGKATVDTLKAQLSARDRKASSGTAPASGLYLDSVHYETEIFDA